jgi:hypothetical protein
MESETKVEKKQQAKRGVRRTYNVRLDGRDSATLHVRAILTKTGARSEAFYRAEMKGKPTRGASAEHATIEQAKAAVDALVLEAVKLGWKERITRAFARRADQFDAAHLPAPGKAAKK